MKKAKSDTALKEFWRDNERFVDLFNTVFFHGEKVLKSEEMEEKDTDVSSIILSKEMEESLERYRDVVKYARGMNFMILGIENQDKIHYAMPLRCRIYDDLQYLKQVKEIVQKNKKENWKEFSKDEFLCKIKREDRIKPCLTIVIYYGEKEWDGPRCLADMADVPEEIWPYFQDYQMHLLCVRDEDGSSFSHRDVIDLFYVLNSFYRDKENEIKEKKVVVNQETYQAIAAVQKNDKLLKGVIGEEKGAVSMCSALERIWEDGRKEGIKEGGTTIIENLLVQGILSLEQIAQAVQVSLDRVEEVEKTKNYKNRLTLT